MLFPNGKASVLPHIFISMSFRGEVHFVSSFPLFSSQIHRPQTTKRLSSDSSNNRGMLTDQHCPEPLLLQLLIHPGWEKGFLSQNVFQNSEQTKRKCLDIMKIWPFSTLKGFFHLLWKEGAFFKTEISPSSQWMSFPLPKGRNKASLNHWQHMEEGAAGSCLFPLFPWHTVLLLPRPPHQLLLPKASWRNTELTLWPCSCNVIQSMVMFLCWIFSGGEIASYIRLELLCIFNTGEFIFLFSLAKGKVRPLSSVQKHIKGKGWVKKNTTTTTKPLSKAFQSTHAAH